VIARVLRATARSEQEALAMAVLWSSEIGPFERARPGFQGGILLREGPDLLAVSCWDGMGAATALDPLYGRVAASPLDDLLARPLTCRFRAV
jgi:hypothetical protein